MTSLSHLAGLCCFLIALHQNFGICLSEECRNCCTKYKEINDPRRSITSVWKTGHPALCDIDLQSGWYRFISEAGGKMPEKTAQEYTCGTHDPIWLDGSHPTEKEGNVVRKACIHSFGNPCDEEFNINVKNCGSYYVYYLKPTYYCAAAYCAGEKTPCPYGQGGVEPDCYDPKEFSSDNLEYPTITFIEDKAVDVSLRCEARILKGIHTRKDVTYRIEWFADGKSVKNDSKCDSPPGQAPCHSVADKKVWSTLDPDDYTIGQWIVCRVSAKFTTSPEKDWSKPKSTPSPFFAGLKFDPSVVTLTSCELLSTEKITITPTIPIRKHPDRGTPKIMFLMPPDINLVDAKSSCKISLQEGMKSTEIRIKAACKTSGVTEGQQIIIPKLLTKHFERWGHKTARLPKIMNLNTEN